MKTLAILSCLLVSAWAAPQVKFGADEASVTSCGLINGQERKVGDVWESDCNNCICRDNGIATCTKRFCGNIPVLRPGCTDSSGVSRLDGSSWKEKCNRCTCNSGNVACTQALCDKAVCKNVINGEDRVEGEVWTAADGCNTCSCLETGLSGCTKKLCLDRPLITTSSPIRAGGGIPCLGCPQESSIDEDILSAAAHATASLAGISDSRCGGINLIKVERAEKQVVAGTNFFLTLRLETRSGQGCADKTQKICQNIVVFKPLPFACSSEDGCLKLTNQEKISCREAQPPRKAVCKNVINGEDRMEGDTWTAADGCNTCRCLMSGVPGCTKIYCRDKPLITTSSPVRANTLSCPGCTQDTPIDEDILSAATHATASLAGINTVSGCGGISLVNVENAKKQVVAGTNYILTLRLETRGGQGCADKIQKICQNIVVFKPLPFACQSQDGCLELTRQPGISCTEAQPLRAQLQRSSSLFSLNSSLDTANIIQCTGNGKLNCKAISVNNNILDNISVGDKVSLVTGLDVDLTLKRSSQGPSSTSFVFTVGKFGEAIITIGNNKSSVFGSIKPATGNLDYFIENCGAGCNVIYQRDSGFFNQFED